MALLGDLLLVSVDHPLDVSQHVLETEKLSPYLDLLFKGQPQNFLVVISTFHKWSAAAWINIFEMPL